MATADKTVKVTLVAVTTPYAKGMTEAAQQTKTLGKNIDEAGVKARGLNGGLSSAAKGIAALGAAAAGTAVVAFLGDAVKAAGDLQQSVGGVETVFGAASDKIKAFGKDSAENVGLSTNSFNELITVTGALLKNKGLTDFADQSLKLVQIGADLSAQFGGTAKDAVEALNAAMRGESDPIERYGISLNETAVNAELAAKGVQKVNGNFTEQQKTMARLTILQRQASDATGKFASEADTLQGQQQRLNAEWENAKAELGQGLLPALTKTIEGIRGGVDVVVAASHAWAELPGPVKEAAAAMVVWRLAGDRVLGGLGAVRQGVQAFRTELALQRSLAGIAQGDYQALGGSAVTAGASISRTSVLMKTAAGAAKGVGSAMLGAFGGPVGIAITGLTAVIGGYIQAQQNAKKAADDFADTLDKQSGKFTNASRSLAIQKFFGDFSQADYAKVRDALEKQQIGVADLVAAYEQGGKAVDDFKARFDKWRSAQNDPVTRDANIDVTALGNSYAALGRDIDGARKVFEVSKDATDKLAASTAAAVGPTEAVTAADKERARILADTAKDNEAAIKAAKDYAQALLDLHDAQVGASDANIGLQQSLADANDRLGKRADLTKQLADAEKKARSAGADPDKIATATERLRIAEKKLAEGRAKGTKGSALDSLQAGVSSAQRALDKATSQGGDAAKSAAAEVQRLKDELAGYAKTLDLTTQAGRDNQKSLNTIAGQAKSAAKANLEAGQSQATVNKQMDDARAKFIQTAQGFGASKKAAEDMATQYGLTRDTVDEYNRTVDKIVPVKPTKIVADTSQAKPVVQDIQDRVQGIKDRNIAIRAHVVGLEEITSKIDAATQPRTLMIRSKTLDILDSQNRRAGGGYISGPGTGTSDSIPAWLSNGEYVIKAAAVAKYGAGLLNSINSMRFAQGGYVSRMPERVMVQGGPPSHSETHDSSIKGPVTIIAHDYDDFRQQIYTEQRRARLSPLG